MSIDETKVKKFEREYKQAIFNKINEICSIQAEEIILIGKNERITEQLISDIPNIGIRLNNKLNELSQVFNKAGISMYSSKIEDIDTVTSSFIGDAIIIDLIGYLSQATKKLEEYDKKSQTVINGKKEQSLMKISPVRRFFTKIRSFFSIGETVDISLTEEEKSSLKEPLDEYANISDEIWKYNLKDNVVPSIVKHIHDTGYAAFTVPGLVEESVIPDLQKLGLSDLIPELQSALVEEYKKDALNLGVSEEEMGIYVPNFNKETQNSSEIETDDNKESTEKSETSSQDTSRTFIGKGITPEELDAIDRIINAQEEVANGISQESPSNLEDRDEDDGER